MKLYRSLLPILAILLSAQMVFAGGVLKKERDSFRQLNRNEQMAMPDMADLEAEAPVQEAVIAPQPASEAPTQAASPRPQGQSHKQLRMTKAEKKALRKRARNERSKLRLSLRKLRDAKKQESSAPADGLSTLILVIIAILLPPLAVLLYDGLTTRFLISILLWLLFYIPGLIYALIVILE